MPEVTPVVHTTFGTVQTVTQDEIYGVGRRPGLYYNWYTADLTGFAIHSQGMAGSGVITAIDDFRVRGESAMKPGERRETLKDAVRATMLWFARPVRDGPFGVPVARR